MLSDWKRHGLIVGLVMGVSVAVVAGPALAQVYYTFPGAPVVKKDEANVGTQIGFSDALTRILGYGRVNVSEFGDAGLEVVIDNFDIGPSDSKWRVGIAGDYRHAIVPSNKEMPFDLTLGTGFGLQSGANFTNFNIPVHATASRPIILENERALTPYGALYVIYTRFGGDAFDPPPFGSAPSRNEFDVELRAGAAYEITDRSQVYSTIYVGEDWLWNFGINLEL